MIHKTKRIGFRVVRLFFEPVSVVMRYAKARAGSYIHIYSYESLSLPSRFRLLLHKKTPRISLGGKSIEEVLSSFHDTARNEVRRTLRDADIIYTTGDDNKKEAYACYKEFERSQGRTSYRWRTFRDLIVFSAREGEMLLSGIACYDARPVLKVFSIYSRRSGGQAQHAGRASKRLVFELCKYGILHGYEYVDLSYVNLRDPKKEGIDRFKMQFGGEIVDEYQYRYVSSLFQLILLFRRLMRSMSLL